MAEHHTQQHQQGIMRPHHQQPHQSTAGGSLLVLSGLTLAGTVIALTIATPLLVILSPVLVSAVITMFMLGTGFLASGGIGVAALSVLSWMYRYMTVKHPMGAEQLDTYEAGIEGNGDEGEGRAFWASECDYWQKIMKKK